MKVDIKTIKAFFGASTTGCILVEIKSGADPSKQTRILFINPAAKKLLGFSGRTHDPIVQSIGNELGKQCAGTIFRGKNGRHIQMEFLNSTSTKDPVHLVLVRDVTESVAMENKALILTNALNSVQDAVYVIDKGGKELFHNPRIKRFHPPHRRKMLMELNAAFETGKRVKDKYLIYNTVDNKPVHILSSYFPVRKNEKIIAVVSINKFVTEIQRWFRKAIEIQNQLGECTVRAGGRFNGTRYSFDDIIGESPIFKSVCDKAQKASQSFFPVLIQGETGVGKEIFAQGIHNDSFNSDKPFIAVVCSAIPESLLESTLFGTKKGAFTGSDDTIGLFEQAKEGTLFLDEINSIPQRLQSKLLRVLEEKRVRRVGGYRERPIKCRIISATNEDSMHLIKQGRLRQDIFYRLAGVVLTIPPLRERKQDILLLANHFLKRMNKLYGLHITGVSPRLKQVLTNHRWPGNVRELLHVIEGSAYLVENEHTLTTGHLPDYFQPKLRKHNGIDFLEDSNQDPAPLPERLKNMEKKWILAALRKHDGNVSKSAEALGIKRQNLQSRMKKLLISRKLSYTSRG